MANEAGKEPNHEVILVWIFTIIHQNEAFSGKFSILLNVVKNVPVNLFKRGTDLGFVWECQWTIAKSLLLSWEFSIRRNMNWKSNQRGWKSRNVKKKFFIYKCKQFFLFQKKLRRLFQIFSIKFCRKFTFLWSRANWDFSSKEGGKRHPSLNILQWAIANKYREGKIKSRLKSQWNSMWNWIKGTL